MNSKASEHSFLTARRFWVLQEGLGPSGISLWRSCVFSLQIRSTGHSRLSTDKRKTPQSLLMELTHLKKKVQPHRITPLFPFPSSSWITGTRLWRGQTTVPSRCMTSAPIRKSCAIRISKWTAPSPHWPCLCQPAFYSLDMTTLTATSGTR